MLLEPPVDPFFIAPTPAESAVPPFSSGSRVPIGTPTTDGPVKVYLEKRVLAFPRSAIPQPDFKLVASYFTANSV